MHSNVTIKNISWPHFSWPTLYMMYSIIHYTGSRIRASDWYQNQWPWILNGVMTADARYLCGSWVYRGSNYNTQNDDAESLKAEQKRTQAYVCI